MNASNIAPADLMFSEEIQSRTAPLYDRVKKVIPEIEWAVHAPKIDAINKLKAERNAVILGHNYMTPEIYHCVADIVGDSLALARHAVDTDADVIVMAGGNRVCGQMRIKRRISLVSSVLKATQ